MPEIIETPVESTESPKAAKKTKPKAAKKPAKAPKAKNGTPKTLAKAQVRMLKALSKAKGPLNTALLAERSNVPKTHVTGYVYKRYATKRTDSLCEQRLARAVEIDVDGRTERCYEITAAGKKAVEKLA